MKVLFAVVGSAGDLFPVMPIVARMRHEGHDVRVVAPRPLTLYLRPVGIPSYGIGDGSDMGIFQEAGLISARFAGWASTRQAIERYVLPTLSAHAEGVERVIDDWQPDVMATTSYAVGARLAAISRGIPLVSLSIYPQHQARLAGGSKYGLSLRRAVAAAMGKDIDDPAVAAMTWGAGPETVLLHDRELLGAVGAPPSKDIVGFSYWDSIPGRPGELEQVNRWLDESVDKPLLVTMGSFLGVGREGLLTEIAAATKKLGARALFIGPHSYGSQADNALLNTGFIPLSQIVDRIRGVVHHGGIGTTFGALQAGQPAAVLPLAFDQPDNAALVERAGVGVHAAQSDIASAIQRLLSDERLASRAAETAARLVPPDGAAERASAHILDAVGATT